MSNYNNNKLKYDGEISLDVSSLRPIYLSDEFAIETVSNVELVLSLAWA